MRRNPAPVVLVSASALLVAGAAWAVGSGRMPLGVPGEWEWLRVPFGPTALDLGLAAVGVAAYAAAVGFGARSLARRATPAREAVAVAALALAAVAVQAVTQSGAPAGHGLSKWVLALHSTGSSGYFQVARAAARDPGRFFRDYPVWVRGQDALHLGTHPPGLIAAQAGMLRAYGRRPGAARWVDDHAPESVGVALRVVGGYDPLTPAERATLVTAGALTLLACGLTVAPIYALARSGLPAPSAWAAAALWPLAPAAVMFQPAADAAFPLLAATALALTARRGRGRVKGVLAGAALGIGMQLSLVFLAVGLVAGLVVVTDRRDTAGGRLGRLLGVGLGFLAVTGAVWAGTGADPFLGWWWNQRNHARFYAEFPRSYGRWVVANPVELAVAVGLPAAVWAAAGLAGGGGRDAPRVGVATLAVLALLTLSGRSLSEVARLWMPFLPGLLVLAGAGFGRNGAGPWSLGLTVLLVGAETLALQAMIQVVYPV